MKDTTHWITQGERYVSDDRQAVIATLLGSCVAVCLWDPLAQVGGMNHMLLTSSKSGSVEADRAGVHEMELLINDILKRGGRRSRLVAKVFGGARMISGLSDIGQANALFAEQYLLRERIVILGQSLGGHDGRQLMFWPASGVARQRAMRRRGHEILKQNEFSEGNDAEIW